MATFAAACNSTVQNTSRIAGKPAAVTADKYAKSDMDLAPRPATVTNADVAAPAAMPAVSHLPNIAPLDAAHVKEVRLDAYNVEIEVAPGVKFAAWTFGGSVPGPVVRARVGDLIKFTMTNRSAMAMPGMPGMQVGAPMPHSMDFHSAMVSPQDKYRSILPGETISFEFTANYPGIYMYHCGTPMIIEHLASGMYGMMVVEPKDGFPTKADREYAIVQSEFYLKPSAKGSEMHVIDMARVMSKDASQVTFNGRVKGLAEKPLIAKPGERVRLFVLNAGPSGTSSFHVVGTIFDRVWFEGNPDNQFRGMQTVLLGASNSAIVEFYIPEKGKFIIVDHEFADATKGAIGLIDATGGETASATPSGAPQNDADKGKALFAASACTACHVPASGAPRIAPDLSGVTARRSDEWIAKWLTDTSGMLANDATAKELFAQWKVMMPPTGLTPEQVKQIIAFLHAQDGGAAHDAHQH